MSTEKEANSQIERYPVKRLDQALNVWEQEAFLTALQVEAENNLDPSNKVPLGGPLKHYQGLRQHLLRAYTQEFDVDRFTPADFRIAHLLQGIGMLPYNLYQWTRNSRRIFSLSEDIQLQLENTSLDGVRWSDVRLPFDAYGVDLIAPFGFGQGGAICDFILINKVRTESLTGIAISMFPQDLDEVYFLTERERRTLTNLADRRRWPQLYLKSKEITDHKLMKPAFPSLRISSKIFDEEVLDTESLFQDVMGRPPRDEADGFRMQYYQTASQLIVGFCLYLKQLPLSGGNQSEWIPVPSSPDPTVVTNEAEVCYITSTHPLTKPLPRSSIEGRGGYEMKWHFRRGYWSRRPGQGNNPNAPKIVWHPPQEIRADRKPIGIDSIPSGAETEV